MNTLLLNALRLPVGVLPWQQAVLLVMDGRLRLVESYPERMVRSMALAVPWPSIVIDPLRTIGLGLSASRRNVIARDRFACQFCGIAPRTHAGRPDMERLTVDHVIPRCRSDHGYVPSWGSGLYVPVSSWENLVAACQPCNHRKADRTPEEARMPLRTVPGTPGAFTSIRILVSRAREIPDSWEPYIALPF